MPDSTASTGGTGKRVFVTGGTGFLGYRVVRALLEQGAEVTALVRPDSEEKLGALGGRVQWVQGDVWNPASLRGRGRGHSVAVHLVGGARPDPKRGLTFRHLNYVSARNVAQMAVGDGVPNFVLLSAQAAPLGVAGGYIDSKRDAEEYIKKTGLRWTIIRAPALYAPGQGRNPLHLSMSLLSYLPVFSLFLAAHRAMAVDVAARGIASLALSSDGTRDRLIQPGQLRRLGRQASRRTLPRSPFVFPGGGAVHDNDDADDGSGLDEPPFGWLPPG